MNFYLAMGLLGAAGFAVMAVGGLGRHHGHGGTPIGHRGHGHAPGTHGSAAQAALLASPRLLFAFLFGLGLTGLLLQHVVGGILLLLGAVGGGIVAERFIVAPLWAFAMRFASRPALTIESATTGEATAVTAFDASGHGIVALEIDGQVVQVLATLLPPASPGAPRVRAGQLLRVEEVDTARNRCTVSVMQDDG